MMQNTLGLDDDDAVDLVRELERIFDVEVSEREVEFVLTVGGFHALLLSKIPPNEADTRCASAMAFYRIRRALRRLGYGSNLTPAFNLRALERGRTKSNLRSLAAESGLRLPETISTGFGLLGAFVSFAMALGLIFALQPCLAAIVLGIVTGCSSLVLSSFTSIQENYPRIVRHWAT